MSNEQAYQLAYDVVYDIEASLANMPTRHYFTRAGHRLTSLEDIIRAILRNDLMMTGGQMNTLEQIANNLKAQALAEPHKPQRFTLTGGLHLTCIFQLATWQLSLTRINVAPSQKEVEVIYRDFYIPKKEARREDLERNVNGTQCHVVRLRWPVSAIQASFDFGDEGQAIATIKNNYIQEVEGT